MIDPALIAQIRETHRSRQDFLRSHQRIDLQIKSICRRLTGDFAGGPNDQKGKARKALHDAVMKSTEHPLAEAAFFSCLPLIEALKVIEGSRKMREKELSKLAAQLPVFAFVETINGMGAMGLAQIIGEAGDLSNYATPAKLWTRMCVGRRQNLDGSWSNQGFKEDGRRFRWGADMMKNVDAEGRPVHWYNPSRRSLMFVITDSLIKKQNPYRNLYLSQKAYYVEKWELKKPGRAHMAALRYVAKRLLKHVWIVWRAIERGEAMENYTVDRLFAGDTQRHE